MTRLVSTGWASVLLGLAFTGTALAQTAPNDTTSTTTTDDTTTTTTTQSSDDTNQTTPSQNQTQPSQAPAPKTDVDVDVNVDSDDANRPKTTTNTDATAPGDVDVNVRTPDTVTTRTDTYTPPPPAPVYESEEEGGYHPISGIGIGIAAGGGVGGFTNQALRDATNVGGDWDVRVTVGTRSPIAFEGSYIGSAQRIDALGLDSDALLVGNGVQGALRLNATLNLPVQPFIYAGLGWRHYEITNSDRNVSDINDSDDVLEVPLGVGLAAKWQGLMFDARGEFRPTFENDMVPETIGGSDEFADTTDSASEMHRWGVKATIGLEF